MTKGFADFSSLASDKGKSCFGRRAPNVLLYFKESKDKRKKGRKKNLSIIVMID